jgi:hypothetical protein
MMILLKHCESCSRFQSLIKRRSLGEYFLIFGKLVYRSFQVTWCTGNLRTLSTANGSLKVTNPNPLDRLVAGSFMTMTSASSPKAEKYSRMLSGVVCQDRPPMNILPGSFGMSSPGKADSTGFYKQHENVHHQNLN